MKPSLLLNRPPRAASLATLLPAVFRRIVAVVVLIALLTAGVLALLTMRLWPQSSRLEHGDRNLSASYQAMLDEETGVDAFLDVGDVRFLEPYYAAAGVLPSLDAAVVRDLAGDAALAPLVVQLRVREAQWTTAWAAEAVAGTTPGDRVRRMTPAALAEFRTSGKTYFDDYRSAEAQLRTAVTARIDGADGMRRRLLGSVLVTDLVLAAAVSLLLLRDLRMIRRRVVAPVEEVRKAVRDIADGRTPVGVCHNAVVELRDLSSGVVTLGASLNEERHHVAERDDQAVEHSVRLRQILAMAREIGGSLNVRYVVESVGAAALHVGDYERVLVWLLAEDERSLRLAHDTSTGHGRPADRSAALGEGLAGRAAKFGRLTWTSDGEREAVLDNALPTGSFATPLVVGARIIGVIEFRPANEIAVSVADLELVEALCLQAAVAIEASRLHAQANEMAQVDPLTRLLNRRRLEEDLRLEASRGMRYGRPVSVVMIDLDHFKRVNDTLGHQRADEVLQEVSAILRDQARADDTVYRYGGEEFIVLARETTSEAAAQLAERFRGAIEERFAAQGVAGVTASFGVADMPGDATTEHSVIAQADRALYEAKRLGRNTVVSASSLRVADPHRSPS
jgi:diguanylate cyclase (GGDEF)-like protein